MPFNSFRFSSGGRYHPSPYGEWIFDLGKDGSVKMDHWLGDKLLFSHTYKLTPAENTGFWSLIFGAKIDQMQSSTRPGIPDECEFQIVLISDQKTVNLKFWQHDNEKTKPLMSLVNEIKTLIPKYTKQKCVI